MRNKESVTIPYREVTLMNMTMYYRLLDEEFLAIDDIETFKSVDQCLAGCDCNAAHLT